MKPIILQFNNSSSVPLYIQLYSYIKSDILAGNMQTGEKLPSLRELSKNLNISVTTTELAYNQLLVEGYITSKPQSGYYIGEISFSKASNSIHSDIDEYDLSSYTFEDYSYKYDLNCFDFNKWKKCMSKVLNEYSHLLLFESDPQGEAALRFEISKYVYTSRGVTCSPNQIVIGAGTQQLIVHLARILRKININHVAMESPGYLPVQNIFRDHGFAITKIPVASDGITISNLPTNIPTAAYVSPSNQFPTGTVMPIGKRYQLLEWAAQNNSIILEDDYDSELRYFGKPVPALQGLDDGKHVVYFGSFSSTLFSAIKISYMILPNEMINIFNSIKSDYTQTCSKTEQLTLALFMENGFYYTNIKKLRNLYSQKLQVAISALANYANDFIEQSNTKSGINMIIKVESAKSVDLLCDEAKSLGILVQPIADVTEKASAELVFYYNKIPIDELKSSICQMIDLWRK